MFFSTFPSDKLQMELLKLRIYIYLSSASKKKKKRKGGGKLLEQLFLGAAFQSFII